MIVATCASIAAILASAQGGETIMLRGACPTITISKKVYKPAITIQADKATVKTLEIMASEGVNWQGGVIMARSGPFAAGTPAGYGIQIRGSKNVTIDRVFVRDSLKGIVIRIGAENITVKNSRIEYIGGDAFNIASSKNVKILNNTVRTFYPNGNYHQDGVQMWNAADDILIQGNYIEGPMQGINDFGATGQPPVNNVRILNNTVVTSHWHGITLWNATNSLIKGNEVKGINPARTSWISIKGTSVQACQNTVWDQPGSPATLNKC